MANCFYHAQSSVRRWGGSVEDYQPIHNWFDSTKEAYADWRHRALRHHSQGIFEAERQFGTTITNSDGREVPVRLIGEQHVREDCGYIPSIQDWLSGIPAKAWMLRGYPLDNPEEPNKLIEPKEEIPEPIKRTLTLFSGSTKT